MSFHVLVGYPEVYPGVYHMKFQIFFSCSTELQLWLSLYRWTPCHWFPFRDLFKNPYFKALLQLFLEWFLQVVSNWSGPLRNWYSLLFHAADKSSSFLLSLILSIPLNVSLNCSFIVLISGFGFFVLEWTLTSGISFWNSEAGEGLRVLCWWMAFQWLRQGRKLKRHVRNTRT